MELFNFTLFTFILSKILELFFRLLKIHGTIESAKLMHKGDNA